MQQQIVMPELIAAFQKCCCLSHHT